MSSRKVLHVGLTALSSLVITRGATAQEADAAAQAATAQPIVTAAAAAAAAASTEGSVQLQASPVPADRSDDDDFITRYKPQDNLWEAGVFIGPMFISDDNSLRGPTRVNPGSAPTVQPISTFKQPSVEVGIRGGYYPLAWLGGELEGMVTVAETDAGEGATVLAGRAQVVLQSPLWSVVPFITGGVGYWAVQNEASGDDADPAFHFGGGAKVNVTENLAVRVDVRDSITNQRGSGPFPHNIEALAGANLVFGRKPVGPKDSDGDGIFDDRDQCPLDIGNLPNGCADRDSDADGIFDSADQCRNEVGIAPSGCPIPDADQDGINDSQDQCVSQAGVQPTGCPDGDMDGFIDASDKCPAVPGVAPDGCLADADGDGLVGAEDRCPDKAETRNGFEDSDGCPDELPAAVKDFMGVIAGIEFDNAQSSIRKTSEASLTKALTVLNEYPSLRIEIIGHTDSRGARENNIQLSQDRAASVKGWLISNGIDSQRITTRGEGPDVPITTNETPAGRQKNRRIEFRVIE